MANSKLEDEYHPEDIEYAHWLCNNGYIPYDRFLEILDMLKEQRDNSEKNKD